MAYNYIKQRYGLTFEVGDRVRHTITKMPGTVRRENKSASHYVQVRFDGRRTVNSCHPQELLPEREG